jgi:hypothetical protein
MKKLTFLIIVCASCMLIFSKCADKGTAQETTSQDSVKTDDFYGFGSQVKMGEHLVHICGCNDCHTPKKMTDHGPDMDWDLMLSGHPANAPEPPGEQERNGRQGTCGNRGSHNMGRPMGCFLYC